jgi:hypothetical protein
VTGSSSLTLAFSATSAGRVILPAVLAYVTVEPHYHLAAEHDDPIALGTEVGLVLALLFVSWKLVACRLLHPS